MYVANGVFLLLFIFHATVSLETDVKEGPFYNKLDNSHCNPDKYGIYSSVEDAEAACSVDSNCRSVYDNQCDESSNDVYLCPIGSSYLFSRRSCIYGKAERFKIVDSTTCESNGMLTILSKSECETAAQLVGLRDTSAYALKGTFDRPNGCIFNGDSSHSLFFYDIANGVTCGSIDDQNSDTYNCLCKRAPETCEDGIQNQDETDIDCGGACSACATCNDGIQNQDETDVDCGGASCNACATCNDGIENQDETDVDCGGASCNACGCFENDFAYPGNDIGEKRTANSPEDCQQLCKETDGCVAFTFRANRKGCWLKNIKSEGEISSGAISGIRNCKADECKTTGDNQPNRNCVFPFWFGGTLYESCTTVNAETPWCATEVDSDGHQVSEEWGFCAEGCPVTTPDNRNCVTVTGVVQNGKYFKFMHADVNAVLGSYISGSTHDVEQWRDGSRINTDVTVTIMTAEGRYDPFSAAFAGQWQTGDKFCFNTDPTS